MEFEDYVRSQTERNAQLLSNFSQDPRKFTPQQLLAALQILCKHQARLQFTMIPKLFCGLCESEIKYQQTAKISCEHDVHKKCLQSEAIKCIKTTMNQDDLKRIVCKVCSRVVTVKRTSEILGDRFIKERIKEAKQEDEKRKAREKMEEEERLKEERLKKEQKNRKQKSIPKVKVKCQHCKEDKENKDIVALACFDKHKICQKCLVDHLQAAIKKKEFQQKDLSCPVCRLGIDDIIIQAELGSESYKQLETVRYQKLKRQIKNDFSLNFI